MLYPEKNTPSLSDELFRNPGCAYRGAPFWAWNGRLEKDRLLEQIEYFKQMGFGGYHMHPRVGLATAYLSDAFMDMIRACVEKGRQEDMLSYLYDEDRWPSGAAGGFVTKDHRLRGKYILFADDEKECVSMEEMYACEKPYLYARYDIEQNAAGELLHSRRLPQGERARGKIWYAYLYVLPDNSWYNGQAYLDTLRPDAVDAFLRVTHEAYARTVGETFGTRVPSIFTDEPQFVKVRTLKNPYDGFAYFAWTEALDALFLERSGETLIDALPQIVFELPDHALSPARYHYYNCLSDLFADSFAKRCGAWCDAHNIALTGHLMNEPTLLSQTIFVGDAMRAYPHFGIPGIDMLCDHREFTTAKQCQSAVHQCGKEAMLSELYGVTNWDYDFKHHKSQGDWQAALGVTLRVPHLSLMSMKGEAKRDYPASIHYQSPWYREYRYIEDHFARVNTAMTRGKPMVPIAVIHPIESFWFRMGPTSSTYALRDQPDEHFEQITRWLLYGAVDFDFINEATLPSQYGGADGGLHVGAMTYRAVIVPDCITLRQTTLDILRAFAQQGGTVIFAGDVPVCVDAQPSDEVRAFAETVPCVPFTKYAILQAVSPFRQVTIRQTNGLPADRLLYGMRQDNSCRWLFIAHGEKLPDTPSFPAQDLEICLDGTFVPTLYDTVRGEILPVPYRIENGQTIIPRRMERTDSILLRLDECADAPGLADAPKAEKHTQVIRFFSEAKCDRSEPNVLLLDRASYALGDGEWQGEEELLRIDTLCREQMGWPAVGKQMVQPWVHEQDQPTETLTLRFTIRSEIDCGGVRLALENAADARIEWNGDAVSPQIVGYFADRDIPTVALPPLQQGDNTLLLRIPFGRQTSAEWCYLLGDFGVRVDGCVKTVVAKRDMVGFSSVTDQGMPFYGGNLLYTVLFSSPAGELSVHLPHVGGALARVKLDGRDLGVVALAPFTADAGYVTAGKHTLEITCYGNRYNSFGPLHSARSHVQTIGPGEWRTQGDDWQYEYRLKPTGILSAPEIIIRT